MDIRLHRKAINHPAGLTDRDAPVYMTFVAI